MRLQLKAGLPLIRRGPATVQIGLDPRHGTVLDGLTEADLSFLQELAGGVDARRPHPPPAGGSPEGPRTRELLDLLAGTGVLQRSRSGRSVLARLGPLRARLAPDAAAWSLARPDGGDGWELLARRGRAVVELRGGGRTALLLAGSLAAAGVGTVRGSGGPRVTAEDVAPGGAGPEDVGAPPEAATARVVQRAGGGPGEDATGPRRAPDLVVLFGRGAADPGHGDRLLAADVAHLSVVVRETSIVVGPLVVPGHGACLRCLDLHRAERDPQWPVVLAQLLAAPPARLPREETALAQAAAGVAALQVLGHLDGRRPDGPPPAGTGATLEVELPDGVASRRPWPAHPSCGCSWPPAPAG